MPGTYQMLGDISLFRGMSKRDVLKFMSLAEGVKASEGELIIKDGDPGDALYIVQEGTMAVWKDLEHGQQEMLAILSAGEFFGEMALIDSSPRSANVTALGRSLLYKIRGEKLVKFLEDEPHAAAKLYRNFATALTARLRYTTDKLRALSMEGVEIKKSIDRMTSDIISVVSHEFRTPVAVIKGAADVLEDVPLTADRQGKLLSNIQKHTEHLASLLDDIAQFADVEMHGMRIEKAPCDVAAIIREVVTELDPRVAEFDVAVKNMVRDGLPMVPAHREKLKRALFHLIDNGIRFNKKGGKLLISVNTDRSALPPEFSIRIEDEGPGIPAERRDELFRCFCQGASSMAVDRPSGVGIGLPFARSVAIAHGGRLKLESPREGGSVFTLVLPIE